MFSHAIKIPAIPAIIAAAVLLSCGPALWAQEAITSDDNQADQQVEWDRRMQDLQSRIDDLRQDIDREAWFGFLNREDLATFANGGVRPGFTENLAGQLPWFELQLTSSSSRDRSCSNTYGATLAVPFGSYEGNQILNLSETTVDPPVFPVGSDFNRALTSWGGAWSFEPGGMLIRMVELVDVDVTVTPEPRQFVDCKTTIRYRYVGARGDYTFTKRGLDDEQCSFRVDNSSDPRAAAPGSSAVPAIRRPARAAPSTGRPRGR